jgi:hypothetical protein
MLKTCTYFIKRNNVIGFAWLKTCIWKLRVTGKRLREIYLTSKLFDINEDVDYKMMMMIIIIIMIMCNNGGDLGNKPI